MVQPRAFSKRINNTLSTRSPPSWQFTHSPFPNTARPRPLNLLSKYWSTRPSNSPPPGLPVPPPILKTASADVPPAPKTTLAPSQKPSPPPVVSFSRSGDREEKRGGGVDDAFEVEGVKVPERPLKPGEEDCCMSGCVHCIYDLYAASLLAYQTSLSAAHKALLASSRPRANWPAVVREREERGVKGDVTEVLEEMDPSRKAFLEMEGRLKLAKKVAAGA